jgi:hypothetical protein
VKAAHGTAWWLPGPPPYGEGFAQLHKHGPWCSLLWEENDGDTECSDRTCPPLSDFPNIARSRCMEAPEQSCLS